MSFLEIVIFLVSIPGYIADIVQLLGLITSYLKDKEKAKGTSLKANANEHREV